MHGRNFLNLRELPTTTNAAEDLKRQAQVGVERIEKLPLEQIVEDLAVNMHEIKVILTSQSLKENRQGINQSIKEMEKLLINNILMYMYPKIIINDDNAIEMLNNYIIAKLQEKIIKLNECEKSVINGKEFMNLLLKRERRKIFVKLNK